MHCQLIRESGGAHLELVDGEDPFWGNIRSKQIDSWSALFALAAGS